VVEGVRGDFLGEKGDLKLPTQKSEEPTKLSILFIFSSASFNPFFSLDAKNGFNVSIIRVSVF